MAARPAAVVKAKGGCGRIAGLFEHLGRTMSWCIIIVLDFSRVTIGAEGAGRLVGMLGQCPSLAHLDLCGNNIGAEGAGSLDAVAEQCSSLEIIR